VRLLLKSIDRKTEVTKRLFIEPSERKVFAKAEKDNVFSMKRLKLTKAKRKNIMLTSVIGVKAYGSIDCLEINII